MSILIKGMKMPATGGFITLQICGDGTVRVVNKATGGVYIAPAFEEANGTDERIRASSVPTPHGRLIDARVLQHAMMDMVQSGLYRLEDMINAVIEAPTVIEAEEVEGR